VTPSSRIDTAPGQVVRLETDDPLWRTFVSGREEALAFHLPGWARTLSEAYGFKSFCLGWQSEDGSLSAGIPVAEIARMRGRRWISLPFTDVCPPLGDGDDVSALVNAVEQAAATSGIRGMDIRSPVAAATTTWSPGVVHELRLNGDPEALIKTFSKSQVQRNIARARREGVIVRRGERSDDLLRTFVSLHSSTRRRLGVPTQPLRFFRQLWDHMIAPGHGFVLVSYVGEAPAAAAVFLLGGRTVTYKFGASDSKYWPQRPNHLLFWEAIRWGCEHDFRAFDFGRSDWGHEGLRAFKAGWGAEERELVYSSLGRAPRGSLGLGARVAQPVIRHSPQWANRAIGRLLYRYAA
jgi:CelD/BcsL family acetyltransferase involved in cellulose biosynthesis